MLTGASLGAVELRRAPDGAIRLRGRFPYSTAATLRGGPDPRREVFAARAFAPRIEAGADIHLLVQHDYDRPLASRAAGSLRLEDRDDALAFEAEIAPELRGAGYVTDFLAGLEAGLVRGLSPGFRVPAGGETVKRNGAGLTRVIARAELLELSAVTVPAYEDAQIEARRWSPDAASPELAARRRWRV